MKKQIIKMSYYIFMISFFLLFTPKQNIKGLIRMVGTAIFPELTIYTEDNKEYYFDKKFFDEFKPYVGKVINIEAKIQKKTLWLADRSKSFDRYTIMWVKKID